MGGSTHATTNTVAEPWDAQKEYLKDVFAQASDLYGSGGLSPEYYGGNTVANQSQWTQQAMQMQADRALNGSQSIANAQAGMDNIAGGNALAGNAGLNALNQMTQASNPYIDALYSKAANAAASQLNGNFSQAGRYGSGAHENALAQSATDLANEMYSTAYEQSLNAANNAASAYNTGLNAQINAAGTAKDLANQAYTDAAALSEAGSVMDDYNQMVINADIDRYNYNANSALNALSNYMQLINGSYGGTTTNTGQQKGNASTLGNVIGGASTALGIADLLKDYV